MDKKLNFKNYFYEESVDESFMDAIRGKNVKKRNSENAEQAKISTEIDRKLKLIDGLMKKVKPLGGKMTRLTSFRKTPIKKMTPKDLYKALNDWYLSIDDYLNDNPEVDKRHGSTVVKIYSLWEEVSDKIQDYMWASGYNVERGKRGKRGSPNKMGNIIADVKMSKGPVMVQTKKLKVGGKLVDIDYNVPKRTDPEWLKMNESVNVYDAHYDAQNHSDGSMSVKKVLGKPRLIMKSYHKEKDGHSFAKKHGYKVNNFTKTMSGTRMDIHNMNESVDEGFMDKMKQLVPGARNPQKPQQGKKTAMEMQFPYARLSVHRMIVALRKARGAAMKGKAQGKDRRENERSLGLILAYVEDIARNRHAEQPNSGRQIHDDGNIDDITQQYFMDKIRQNDWTKADQEILNAMVGNGTDDNTKGGAYHARTLAHDIALSVKYAKKDAGIKESVNEAQIDKMKYISKGFMGRKEAERHNDKLVGSGKASNKSYVHDHKDGKFYVVDVKESIEVDEVFTPQMRRAAARRMKILAPRIKLGLKRSKNRTATKEKLMNRAVRSVKDTLIKKFTKGKSKTELSPARRAEMEKRIKKLGPRIKRLAMKQLPATRQLERDRKQARAK